MYRNPLYLVVKNMVSCRFSLKPIQWSIRFGRKNHLPIWSGSPNRWWIPFSSSCFTQWSSHLFRHYTGGFFLAIPIVDYDNPPICKGRLMAPNHQPSFINDILKMFDDSTPLFLDGQTSRRVGNGPSKNSIFMWLARSQSCVSQCFFMFLCCPWRSILLWFWIFIGIYCI